MKFSRSLFFLALALSFVFVANAPVQAREDDRQSTQRLWLVSNGFHSALGLRTRDAGPALRKLVPDPRAEWVMFGWGNAEFFTAYRITVPLLFNAIFIPSPSAIHVVPLHKNFPSAFPHSDVIRLEISPERLQAVRKFLIDAFARDACGAAIPYAPGYFATSRFYLGRELTYFPKMCNVWAAHGLRKAGVPIFVPSAIVANDLVWQTARHGRRESWKRFPTEGF